MANRTVVRQRGEGDAIWMLGGLYEVKAATDETGGGLTVMEVTVPDGAGPVPHTHPGGEAVYVLEGTVRYHIDGEVAEGGPGAFFYIPQGVVENFEPIGTVRVLVIYQPGGMDQFFKEVGEPAESRRIPPQSGPPDIERLVSVGARYGMRILPPSGPS